MLSSQAFFYNKMDIGMHLKSCSLVKTARYFNSIWVYQEKTRKVHVFRGLLGFYILSRTNESGFFKQNKKKMNCGQESGEAADRNISELCKIAEFCNCQIKILIN